MKIGLKIRKDNLDLITKFEDIYDFFEIYIDPEFPLEQLKQFSGRDITIHAAHYDDKFDPSDVSLHEFCRKVVKLAVNAADIVNSPWIIVHPGQKLSDMSKENMFAFFNDNWDKRFVFENCPAVDYSEAGAKYLFALPDEMKYLTGRFKTNFVLDFGHAICTANALGLNVDGLINEFIALNPKCFHVSGIEKNSKKDTHLHLFDVNNNMEYLKKIRGGKYFTFETPSADLRNRELQQKDIGIFNKIMQEQLLLK